jgi:hypothetical protein
MKKVSVPRGRGASSEDVYWRDEAITVGQKSRRALDVVSLDGPPAPDLSREPLRHFYAGLSRSRRILLRLG